MVRQSDAQIGVVSQRRLHEDEEKEFLAAVDDVVAEVSAVLAHPDESASVTLMSELLRAERIHVLGAGRSKLAADSFGMRLMHLGMRAHSVGEVTAPGVRDSGDLVIACSGSGETPTVVHLARAARDAGAQLAVVTGTATSSLAALSDLVIALPECSREGVRGESTQFVGTLFEQGALLYFDSLILTLERRLEADRTRMLDRHTNLE